MKGMLITENENIENSGTQFIFIHKINLYSNKH